METGKPHHKKDRSPVPAGKASLPHMLTKEVKPVASTELARSSGSAEIQTRYQKLEGMELVPVVVPEKKPKRHSKTRVGRKSKTGRVTKELIAKHEWGALLHAFDEASVHPSAPAASAATASEMSAAAEEADIASDELWERLSGTRWLKDSGFREGDIGPDLPDDPSKKTTVVHR